MPIWIFDVSNLENAESIIVKNKTMEADDGIEIQVEVMASAMPVKEAVDMITFLLPFTFGAAILFSIVFSFLYSRHITRPHFSHAECHERYEKFKTGSGISCAGRR